MAFVNPTFPPAESRDSDSSRYILLTWFLWQVRFYCVDFLAHCQHYSNLLDWRPSRIQYALILIQSNGRRRWSSSWNLNRHVNRNFLTDIRWATHRSLPILSILDMMFVRVVYFTFSQHFYFVWNFLGGLHWRSNLLLMIDQSSFANRYPTPNVPPVTTGSRDTNTVLQLQTEQNVPELGKLVLQTGKCWING